MIHSLRLSHIRCFSTAAYDFSARTLIVGDNGTGKTSIIEALYYACYHRSFRTHRPAELFTHSHAHAHIHLVGTDTLQLPFTLTIGMTADAKRVTLNDVAVRTYKDIFDVYRVVLLSDYDIQLSAGSPDARRTYLDQAAALLDTGYTSVLRQYKTTLEQRNALLAKGPSASSRDQWMVWTDTLCTLSDAIRTARVQALTHIHTHITQAHQSLFPGTPCPIKLSYTAADSYTCAQHVPQQIYTHEWDKRRTRIGAHLDDMLITWNGVGARAAASRGQHKRIALLLKLAQRLCTTHACMLIDDFITDLDPRHAQALFDICDAQAGQLIMTTPSRSAVSFIQPTTEIFLPPINSHYISMDTPLQEHSGQ